MRTPQIPPPRMKPHLTVSAVGRDPSSHPKKPPTGRRKRILVAGTATGIPLKKNTGKNMGRSSHHSQRKKICQRSRGPLTTSPASVQRCPPPLPAMEAEERDTHKRANRERYHLAAYELQDDMWNEEKRFDAAYVRKVNEIWGISDHPMSDDIPETEAHPWSDPKNTEEPLNETL